MSGVSGVGTTLWMALEASTALTVGLSVLLGLAIGSFLTVVAHRMPARVLQDEKPHMGLAWPGSHCPQCTTPLTIWQNVPVLGYLMLRGRCGFCREPISIRYPLTEALTALLFGAIAWQFGPSAKAIAAFVFVAFVVALSLIDLEHFILPDELTLLLMWLGLLVNTAGLFCSLESAVWAAALGYASLWLIHHLYLWVRKKEGLGYGDFKLLAAIGAWLGLEALPWVLFGAASIGAVVGLVGIVVFKRASDAPLPFGPFLATAAIAVLFTVRH
jgi:leader peptidase (prepilin peptidase)/N-methyltransferase